MRARRRLFIAALALLATAAATAFLTASRAGVDDRADAFEPAVSVAPGSATEPSASAELPGAREVQAMAAAYPERITAAAVRSGEWALEMDDRWYYWADGRLLPRELRDEAESYASIRFYRYARGPTRVREVDAELERILEDRTSVQASGETDARERFNGFLDALYQISSRADAERAVIRVELLGSATRVHPSLVEPLERVERTIRALAPHDREVAAFLRDLDAVHGYTWRSIAGTARRSYHSYGVAVDLVPRSYAGSWPYWLWAAQGGIDRWWELPLESRWQIPQPVIDAFEDQGFVWGGKWLFFDNLHFEYRPESILMARAETTP